MGLRKKRLMLQHDEQPFALQNQDMSKHITNRLLYFRKLENRKLDLGPNNHLFQQ